MDLIQFWNKIQERMLKVFYAHSTFQRAYPFVLKKMGLCSSEIVH